MNENSIGSVTPATIEVNAPLFANPFTSSLFSGRAVL